ncbi:MAG: hypothetical protein PHP57_13380 [Sideroxydans sp.]|nr:hypothetical protein [Sideroxydans sp.]
MQILTDAQKLMAKMALVVLLAIGLFASGWVVKGWADDSEARRIEQAIAKTREISNNVAASAIAGITVTNTTIQGKVIEHVRTETIYTECKHSPETYQLIKDAFK